MKKLITLLLLLCICFPAILVQAAPQYVSIAELREEVAGGWHQTYEAHGRTIIINCDDIAVPDVEAVPVLTVVGADAIPEDMLDSYVIMNNMPNVLTLEKGNPSGPMYPDYAYSEYETFDRDRIDWSIYADASTWSLGDAYKQAQAEVVRLYSADVFEQLQMDMAAMESRRYKYKNRKEKIIGDPVDTMGRYSLGFRQGLHGIPILWNGGGSFLREIKEHTSFLSGRVDLYYQTPEDYWLTCSIVEEEALIYDDVPLRSFEGVKHAIEQGIEKGLIRDVAYLRFGYMLYHDPKREDLNWAVPVWCCQVEMYEAAKDEPALYNIDGEQGINHVWKQLYVPAQYDAYINESSTDRDRRCAPPILTWDQVR